MRRAGRLWVAAAMLCPGSAMPVAAQLRAPDRQASLPPGVAEAGRVADTGNGEVGQRQTRDDAAPNINPLQRVDTRIANRLESRIRTRLDADYDPEANAATPFRRADDRARSPGRIRRR